jgi:hypothetical protein
LQEDLAVVDEVDEDAVGDIGGGDNEELRRLRRQIAELQSANERFRRAAANQLSSNPSARSVTVHANKFVRATDVPDADLLETQVTLRKSAYGTVGSSDYRKNMMMATASLSEKFGVARHKVVTDAEDGDQSKNMHVQQVIVGVVHRVKEGLQRSKAMDWMSICVMPHLIAVDKSQHPSTWWDNSEICIWTDPEQLSEDEVRAWQYCINKRFSEGDRIASNWLKDFVYNSSTDALRTATTKKYDRLAENQRGGVTYLYLTLMEMFQMSREVKDAMLGFLSLFKRKGIARYTGENVLLASEEVLGVCKRLAAARSLLDEHVIDVLTGLSICGNARFREMFQHLKQCADLGNLDFLGTISVSDTPLAKIEAILEKAVDTYDKLCVAQVWLRVDKRNVKALTASAGSSCWNCGDPKHRADKCPAPRDTATFEKNRKAFNDSKGSNASGGGGRTNQPGRGRNQPKKGTAEYQRRAWKQAGISVVNGVLMVSCKECGLNLTHSTGKHDEWAENPAAFQLAPSHPYSQACAKLGISPGQPIPTAAPVAAPPPPAASSVQPPQPSGQASSLLAFDRAQLEQKISAFERTSTNPSASDVSDALRALLLN